MYKMKLEIRSESLNYQDIDSKSHSIELIFGGKTVNSFASKLREMKTVQGKYTFETFILHIDTQMRFPNEDKA